MVGAGLAFAGLADLLGRWTSGALPALSPPRRRALEIALRQADAGPEVVEPIAVGWATLDVLHQVVVAGPALIAIDDVQWFDSASTQALTFALRRLGPAVVSVLATRREVGAALPFGLDNPVPQTSRDRLVLGALGRPVGPAWTARWTSGCYGCPRVDCGSPIRCSVSRR